MKKSKDTIEAKKEYRIILNFQHPRTKVTIGTGEPVPDDLSETELQDFIHKGNIAEIDPLSGENIDSISRSPTGKLILSDGEITYLRPCLRTLNFLKANKICKDSLKKLKVSYDEMANKHGITNNFFISEIYKILNEELEGGGK